MPSASEDGKDAGERINLLRWVDTGGIPWPAAVFKTQTEMEELQKELNLYNDTANKNKFVREFLGFWNAHRTKAAARIALLLGDETPGNVRYKYFTEEEVLDKPPVPFHERLLDVTEQNRGSAAFQGAVDTVWKYFASGDEEPDAALSPEITLAAPPESVTEKAHQTPETNSMVTKVPAVETSPCIAMASPEVPKTDSCNKVEELRQKKQSKTTGVAVAATDIGESFRKIESVKWKRSDEMTRVAEGNLSDCSMADAKKLLSKPKQKNDDSVDAEMARPRSVTASKNNEAMPVAKEVPAIEPEQEKKDAASVSSLDTQPKPDKRKHRRVTLDRAPGSNKRRKSTIPPALNQGIRNTTTSDDSNNIRSTRSSRRAEQSPELVSLGDTSGQTKRTIRSRTKKSTQKETPSDDVRGTRSSSRTDPHVADEAEQTSRKSSNSGRPSTHSRPELADLTEAATPPTARAPTKCSSPPAKEVATPSETAIQTSPLARSTTAVASAVETMRADNPTEKRTSRRLAQKEAPAVDADKIAAMGLRPRFAASEKGIKSSRTREKQDTTSSAADVPGTSAKTKLSPGGKKRNSGPVFPKALFERAGYEFTVTKCAVGQQTLYCCPGMDPSKNNSARFNWDYFDRKESFRNHLCAHGVQGDWNDFSENDRAKVQQWVRFAVVTSPLEVSKGLELNNLYASKYIQSLGFRYHHGPLGDGYVLPGVDAKLAVIHGMGTTVFRDPDIWEHLARYGLPEECDFDAISEVELLSLQLFLTKVKFDVL
jgi:hypothetical protein